MRLLLSLPVLLVALAMVLEGPTPAQAGPDLSSSIPDKLKEFGSTVGEKLRAAIDHISQGDIPKRAGTWFSDTYNKVKEKLKTTFS